MAALLFPAALCAGGTNEAQFFSELTQSNSRGFLSGRYWRSVPLADQSQGENVEAFASRSLSLRLAPTQLAQSQLADIQAKPANSYIKAGRSSMLRVRSARLFWYDGGSNVLAIVSQEGRDLDIPQGRYLLKGESESFSTISLILEPIEPLFQLDVSPHSYMNLWVYPTLSLLTGYEGRRADGELQSFDQDQLFLSGNLYRRSSRPLGFLEDPQKASLGTSLGLGLSLRLRHGPLGADLNIRDWLLPFRASGMYESQRTYSVRSTAGRLTRGDLPSVSGEYRQIMRSVQVPVQASLSMFADLPQRVLPDWLGTPRAELRVDHLKGLNLPSARLVVFRPDSKWWLEAGPAGQLTLGLGLAGSSKGHNAFPGSASESVFKELLQFLGVQVFDWQLELGIGKAGNTRPEPTQLRLQISVKK